MPDQCGAILQTPAKTTPPEENRPMTSTAAPLAFEVDLDLIRRLDRNGPRYTSYPTADRFIDTFGPAAYRQAASRRNVAGKHRDLSLYVHLPFCNTVCFYCGCNKVVTRDHSKGEKYLTYLYREIDMQSELFAADPRVTQMHWGGGTPTFFTDHELSGLFEHLRTRFELAQGEYSIEVDPRTVDPQRVQALHEMGFNRMSLGVQDFDPDVQRAVNRLQSEAQTLAVIEAARRCGFQSVNIDLIYGLPLQTLESYDRTLGKVLAAQPDRVAVYNYAHLPARFKPQRRIKAEEIPSPDVKLKLLGLAAQRLTEAGYVYIGMDHFAKPDDALAIAQRHGRLQRNFQGYSTHAECDIVGLGVSAIGAIGPTYSQNERSLDPYYACLDAGELPVMRGMTLTADDLLRRAVIMNLMCHFALSKEAIEIAYLVDFDRYFATELAELAELQAAGLVELEAGWINVTPKGRMLIRNVCMVFDKYLREDQESVRYSRVI
jgi:oxygen-independent coproporphyrinogen-3 oxidase